PLRDALRPPPGLRVHLQLRYPLLCGPVPPRPAAVRDRPPPRATLTGGPRRFRLRARPPVQGSGRGLARDPHHPWLALRPGASLAQIRAELDPARAVGRLLSRDGPPPLSGRRARPHPRLRANP